jgi:hypothetical protein
MTCGRRWARTCIYTWHRAIVMMVAAVYFVLSAGTCDRAPAKPDLSLSDDGLTTRCCGQAAALEGAGEQLEDELEDAKEEVQMLAAGLAQVNQKNEEIAQLKEANATLTEELAAAREEIAMLEAGMKAVAERTRPQEEGQASATGAA